MALIPGSRGANTIRKPASAISTIPFGHDKNFVGREDVLTQLRSILEDGTGHVRATLYGLGGVGYIQTYS